MVCLQLVVCLWRLQSLRLVLVPSEVGAHSLCLEGLFVVGLQLASSIGNKLLLLLSSLIVSVVFHFGECRLLCCVEVSG